MAYVPHVWSRHDKLDSAALNNLEQACAAVTITAADANSAVATANTALTTANSAATAASTAQSSAAASATSAQNAANLVNAPADTAIATAVNGPGTLTQVALDGRYAAKGAASGAETFTHLDAFNGFFGGASNYFVTGASTTNTTTTAAVSAGATVVPVASATGLSAGVMLALNIGTTNQQIVRIASVDGSNNVTLATALKGALTNGATVAPLWINSMHLTASGYDAFAYWITQHPLMPAIGSAKVTLLGNSWFANNTQYATRLNQRFPSATVVNVGVAGNTSTNMLARFDTDVPKDSRFVIIDEPGVNDIISAVPAVQSARNLSQLVAKIRALGATPIITGMVPLLDQPGAATERAAWLTTASIGVGAGVLTALNPPTVTTNTRYGPNAMYGGPTGGSNTGVGSNALYALTTGSFNTAVGTDAGKTIAPNALSSTGIGYRAGAATDSTYVGAEAGYQSVAQYNVMVGRSAGNLPNGVAANASTTALNQTFLGYRTGQPTTFQSNNATAIGHSSVAGGGTYATALGTRTHAEGFGATAIGCDSAGTGASAVGNDVFTLGTALSKVTIPGRLNVARRTPTSSADAQGTVGDITTDDNYVYVKTSTGWKRSALLATF